MSLKQKIIIIISVFLLAILPFSLYAFSWSNIEPYTLSLVLLCSFAALLLAHISIVKMRRYQLKLEQSEERLRLSLWGSGDELWDWKISSNELYRSSSWLNPVELQPKTEDFPPNRQLIHPQDLDRVSALLQEHFNGRTAYFEATYRIKTADDSWTWVLDRGKAVAFATDGKPSRMTGTLKNINLLKQTEEQLQLFARCLHNISDAVVICDTDFVILDVNPSFSQITGKSRQQVLQQRFELSLYPSRFMYDIRQKLSQSGSWKGEIQEQRPNGELYQAELAIDQIKDEQGNVSQYVAVFSDITERKLREAELSRLANSDTLTGLPNRAVFMQKLGDLVSNRSEHALLVFDLDNFKKINDSLGHELGDRLLCKLAERLTNHANYCDKLYRLGGDEFALLLEQTNDLAYITALAKELLGQINQPIQVHQHDLAITSSIGIVLFPDDGADPQALLRNADTAMYHAKSQGANRYLFFNDSMNKQAVKRLQIENLIRYGLKEDYFVVYYQPKMDIASGHLVGMEALVRFITPKGGLISPASFIPVAEETGQIIEIGEVVLRKACRDVKTWIDQGLFHGRVAVNLSSRQFSLPFLCELIDDTLQQTELPSYHLELEITEGTVMQSPPQAIETMKKLRARGIHLAMDDFGTGYSSLAYLKQFPLNTLKIDKAFIDDMSNARGRNMVDTIMTIAHNLNLTVVAEGVEQSEQLDMLRKLRCDVIQGYYYSKPLSAADFSQFLQQQKQQRNRLNAVPIR
ncbi:MAG: EAL domain-containing protein [Gammaproteobacteria bacterium]|nr:EAL domain-containing protein [Gammaproteobacteria bacterium]MBU1555080.1 EAL domain-containing protein [Gammaproteobacteria bacterium]MBU2072313.1 EAL domain-containing protein [Gammaproteobacteria bacterium]MBU2183165.1 EAL domain-containing protein [Gammaproteobacteria bacterium]MBU2203753.1 EAL domain-containing protein [Gammaproteobacteria bacterium]